VEPGKKAKSKKRKESVKRKSPVKNLKKPDK
jgi:hypothetical protein